MLSEFARELVRLSLSGLGQIPDIDTEAGMGFRLNYQSGLSLVLIVRGISKPGLFRSRMVIYIALYEERQGESIPTCHFKEEMRYPRGPSDMGFLLDFTPKVLAMSRTVAYLAKAGELLRSELPSQS